MAHVSILDDAVGAVAGQDIAEGCLVTISASGVHRDLPVALLAASGTANDVYMAFAVPDQFPRPTPAGFFMFNDTTTINRRSTTLHKLSTDFETEWLIGPSVLPTVTVQSGWLVALHRGGYYKLQSGEFNDSANIRVNGAKIKVGTGSKVEYTASATGAIGTVREYNQFDGTLTVTIKEI